MSMRSAYADPPSVMPTVAVMTETPCDGLRAAKTETTVGGGRPGRSTEGIG